MAAHGDFVITMAVLIAAAGFLVAHLLHRSGLRGAAFTVDTLVVTGIAALYFYARARWGVH